MGRRRLFVGYSPAIRPQLRAQVLQGFEADMLKLAMVQIDGNFRQRQMKSRIVIAIHDSPWVHAPLNEQAIAQEITEIEMIRAIAMNVPVVVDVEVVERKRRDIPTTTGISVKMSLGEWVLGDGILRSSRKSRRNMPAGLEVRRQDDEGRIVPSSGLLGISAGPVFCQQ